MKVLLTGAAGFIGASTARELIARGIEVVGLDNYNDYYDVQLKHDRVQALCPELRIEKIDLADATSLKQLFERENFTHVIHLAAQAGVRYSLTNPEVYVASNLVGFANILECCRHHNVEHLVYASSSSVYGNSATPPFREDQAVDEPRSFYAATKASNELMAYTYAHLYGLKSTGLRFFTVYGAWGRPDMAPLLFTRAALKGEPIRVFNHGRMQRDFTYIDDIVSGILGALNTPPQGPDPHAIFNLGNHTPVELERFIEIIEDVAGVKVERKYEAMQPGDMIATMADTGRAREAFGFEPRTPIEKGLPNVVEWCREYFA